MAQIIAILNDKGGVAKTTTTANLGTALWLLGKKVLLVDTDQQCSLTNMLDPSSMNPMEDGQPSTLYEWMKNPTRIPINERYPGLDFVPSSRSMANLPQEIIFTSGHETFMKKRLKVFDADYDYILIDCVPGGKSITNINVLVAADSILIPTEADSFSIMGISNLLSFIHEVNEGHDKQLNIIGYLLTKFEPNKILSKNSVDFYHKNIEELEAPLIPVKIRACQKTRETASFQQTLFEYAPKSTAAEDYMRLAEHIASIKHKPTWTPDKWGKKAQEAFCKYVSLNV